MDTLGLSDNAEMQRFQGEKKSSKGQSAFKSDALRLASNFPFTFLSLFDTTIVRGRWLLTKLPVLPVSAIALGEDLELLDSSWTAYPIDF